LIGRLAHVAGGGAREGRQTVVVHRQDQAHDLHPEGLALRRRAERGDRLVVAVPHVVQERRGVLDRHDPGDDRHHSERVAHRDAPGCIQRGQAHGHGQQQQREGGEVDVSGRRDHAHHAQGGEAMACAERLPAGGEHGEVDAKGHAVVALKEEVNFAAEEVVWREREEDRAHDRRAALQAELQEHEARDRRRDRECEQEERVGDEHRVAREQPEHVHQHEMQRVARDDRKVVEL
jgi:hypothetical protein